ncbi:MAG: TIGR04283 family arsenosugar biosynthesis glycosyltransferase [Pseudomonadota bacterium]
MDSHLLVTAVIPTLNEGRRLESAIDNVRHAGFDEIIVCDGGSSDDTRDIATSFKDVTFILSQRGRGQQLASGIAASTKPIIAIIHADSDLPTDAGDSIRQAMSECGVVGGCFTLAFDQPSIALRAYAWFSQFDSVLTTFGDQAMFARRDALEAVGGMPQLPLFEDVALRKRLRSVGRFIKLKTTVKTSARRYQTHGVLRTQLINGLLLVAFLLGCPAWWLYRLYYGKAMAGNSQSSN